MDDVLLRRNDYRDNYVSPDSKEVIDYIESRAKVDVTYFLKRSRASSSAGPKKRKYVAYIKNK